MKVLLHLSLLLFFISPNDKIQSQVFEGTITYRSVIKRAESSNMPIEQFNMTFKDSVNFDKCYIKDKAYKMVTLDSKSNKPTSIYQYDPKTNKLYSYMAEDFEFCMYGERMDNINITPKIIRDINDTIVVLGRKCSSITIEYDSTNITKLYYVDAEKIDIYSMINSFSDIYMYISECGAIPLKIMSLGNNGAPYHSILTVTEIKEEKLDDKIFKLPKFKQMMKSPF